MLKPNFKSPAVLGCLSMIAMGIGGFALAIYITMVGPFDPFMLFFYCIGLIPFVIGAIALVETVRHEHSVDASILAHNASDNPIKLAKGWR